MNQVKISGFTIIKNAVINNYPIVEAIQSVLPVVDEMIVLIGDCEDETEKKIQSINNPKIKIHHSVWNKNLKTGGVVLADETNKAFQLINPESTWAFYIQGDEVIHEKGYENILQACEKYKDDKKVEGLLFKYIHFYGTFDYVGDSRKWYNREIRIIRNDKNILSYKDAQGFRYFGKRKLNVKLIDAFVHHYGWVKSPEQMMKKLQEQDKYWATVKKGKDKSASNSYDFEDNYDSLQRFTGTHPLVIQKRIHEINWHIELDTSKKVMNLKKRFMYKLEQLTGKRFFDFKNYKILK